MIRFKSQGFTLIELLIVVAIIGILASVAMPAYETYAKHSRFTEVVQAATPFKTAFEVAAQTGKLSALTDANPGSNGIPAAVGASGVVNSVTMSNGTITATGTAAVDNATYQLIPNGITPPIQWTVAGTCVPINLC